MSVLPAPEQTWRTFLREMRICSRHPRGHGRRPAARHPCRAGSDRHRALRRLWPPQQAWGTLLRQMRARLERHGCAACGADPSTAPLFPCPIFERSRRASTGSRRSGRACAHCIRTGAPGHTDAVGPPTPHHRTRALSQARRPAPAGRRRRASHRDRCRGLFRVPQFHARHQAGYHRRLGSRRRQRAPTRTSPAAAQCAGAGAGAGTSAGAGAGTATCATAYGGTECAAAAYERARSADAHGRCRQIAAHA